MGGITMKDTIIVNTLLKLLMASGTVRKTLWKAVEAQIYKNLVNNNTKNRPEEVQKYKYYILKAMYRPVERNLGRGYISKEVATRLIQHWSRGQCLNLQRMLRKNSKRNMEFPLLPL